KILNVEKARFDKMLGSAEIGTLIKALGCGIGNEDFNPNNLRYHRIIIMTDADVDGSHIRTLLLTFFFRQMRELVERGHVYIAQPPLYKVRKGKQEQYLKDDAELAAYQTQVALDGASLYISKDSPPISGDSLESIVKEYNHAHAIISRLGRFYPAEILESMIYTPSISDDLLTDESSARSWVDKLAVVLAERHPEVSAYYKLGVKHDRERHVFLPEAMLSLHGLKRTFTFSRDFFGSGEYRALTRLGNTLEGLLESGAYVQRGEKTHEVANFDQAIKWLISDAMKGHYLQRYKGLGEMNPEQLWETTMDPENRRMLQVTIDDAIGADQLFTTLMGDQVDPRREFIEANALSVENLDI
ncbi:MAG: DNA gyrase subunit B, partial [Pseudomonadales bacterium]|nr:DNA gyrase subunit B [Pseudomonadales bacterium]